MSSSSSSGASPAAAAAAFTPVDSRQQQQQQQQMAAQNLGSALQLPAPVQEEAPSDAEQLCYVHCHICDTVLVVSVPSSSLFKTVTVRCGHCSSLLTVDMRGLLIPTTAATTTASMSANSTVTTTTTTMTSPPPAAAAHHGQFHYPSSFNVLPPRHSLLDEISSANPSLQLLEQHGLGGLIAAASGRNATAPVPLPPPASVGKGGKEPSPRTNSIVNRPPEKRQRVPSAYNRFIKQQPAGAGPAELHKDEIQRIKAGNPDISHREAFSAAAKNWAHFPHIHFGLMPDHQGFRKTSLLPQVTFEEREPIVQPAPLPHTLEDPTILLSIVSCAMPVASEERELTQVQPATPLEKDEYAPTISEEDAIDIGTDLELQPASATCSYHKPRTSCLEEREDDEDIIGKFDDSTCFNWKEILSLTDDYYKDHQRKDGLYAAAAAANMGVAPY